MNGAPVLVVRHVRGHAARVAAAVDSARRHDRRHTSDAAWPPTPPRPAPNYDWWQEFSAQATGLGTTFVPSIAGFGAVLDNLSGLAGQPAARGRRSPGSPRVAGAVVVPVRRRHRSARARPADPERTASSPPAARTSGGSLRLGRGRAGSSTACCSRCVHAWIFDALYPRLTREPDGRAHGVRSSGSAAMPCSALLLVAVQPRLRLRAHPDRRRGSPQRARRLIAGRADSCGGIAARFWLYLLNGVAFLCLVLLYALLAPGAPRSGVRMWLTLGLGRALLFLASLSEARCSMRPRPRSSRERSRTPSTRPRRAVVWPDSPAAEAVLNADSIAP